MIPACANTYLLQTLTREYWGQDTAYHTSDCGAVQYMVNKGYTRNDTYSAAAALNGGMDLNSNTILPRQLSLALAMGLVNSSTLDASVSRTLTWRFRTGMLDPLESQPLYMAKGLNVLGSAANRAAALEGSAQGLVLVKNSPAAGATTPALPLKAGLHLAVLGPQGAAQEALLGVRRKRCCRKCTPRPHAPLTAIAPPPRSLAACRTITQTQCALGTWTTPIAWAMGAFPRWALSSLLPMSVE